MSRHFNNFIVLMTALSAFGYATESHTDSVHNDENDPLAAGTAQREISVGMNGPDVAAVLGVPNQVTTDVERRKVWIYSNIATERAYSESSAGTSALIILPVHAGPGDGGGASSIGLRTVTVIIKFDQDGLVRDFVYRSSGF